MLPPHRLAWPVCFLVALQLQLQLWPPNVPRWDDKKIHRALLPPFFYFATQIGSPDWLLLPRLAGGGQLPRRNFHTLLAYATPQCQRRAKRCERWYKDSAVCSSFFFFLGPALVSLRAPAVYCRGCCVCASGNIISIFMIMRLLCLLCCESVFLGEFSSHGLARIGGRTHI